MNEKKKVINVRKCLRNGAITVALILGGFVTIKSNMNTPNPNPIGTQDPDSSHSIFETDSVESNSPDWIEDNPSSNINGSLNPEITDSLVIESEEPTSDISTEPVVIPNKKPNQRPNHWWEGIIVKPINPSQSPEETTPSVTPSTNVEPSKDPEVSSSQAVVVTQSPEVVTSKSPVVPTYRPGHIHRIYEYKPITEGINKGREGAYCSCGVLLETREHKYTTSIKYSSNGDGTHTVTKEEKCGNCPDVKKTIYSAGCTYDSGKVDGNKITYTCTACGHTKTETKNPDPSQSVEPTPHTHHYTSSTSCTPNGSKNHTVTTTETCTICGDTKISTSIVGCSFTKGNVSDNKITYTCKCGNSYTETLTMPSPTPSPSVEPTPEPTPSPSLCPHTSYGTPDRRGYAYCNGCGKLIFVGVPSTPSPSVEPTSSPSVEPTSSPSVEPTLSPSVEPTTDPEPEITEWEDWFSYAKPSHKITLASGVTASGDAAVKIEAGRKQLANLLATLEIEKNSRNITKRIRKL